MAITIIYIIKVNLLLNIALYKATFIILIVTIYSLIGQLVINTIGQGGEPAGLISSASNNSNNSFNNNFYTIFKGLFNNNLIVLNSLLLRYLSTSSRIRDPIVL